MFRITPGTLVLALLALLLAAFAAFEVRRRLSPVAAVVSPVVETPQMVPVAARDLDPDRPLTEGDIGLVPRTKKQLLEDRAPTYFMTQPKQIQGRVLQQPLPKGAYFSPDAFYSDRMGRSLAERLKPGYRAVTIPVEGVGALDGHMVPGAMVDVIFRNDKATGSMPIGTFTVISDVELLAIGDNSVPGFRNAPRPTNDRSQPTTATLAVPADKANHLKVAEGRGTLSLALRNQDDHDTIANNRPVTLEGLMGVVPPKGPFTSQMYRRGRPTTLVFDNNVLVDRYTAPAIPSDLQFGPPQSPQAAPFDPQALPTPAPQSNMPANPNQGNPNQPVIITAPVIVPPSTVIPTPLPIVPTPTIP